MPFVIKNYGIDSEHDIPNEFLDEIKGEKGYSDRSYPSEYIAGKQGKIITDISEIRNVFSDEDCFYGGHGTNSNSVESIFNEGLYVKDSESIRGYMTTLRGLSSTIAEWGTGNNALFDNQQNNLNNWPHKNAKSIIIVEMPQEYILFLARGDKFSPFYVKNNDAEGYQGYKLRPEFIRGVYDADKNAFIPNENFYKNLLKQEQESLFEEVKKQYMYRYAESVAVAPSECEFKLPLNDEEIKKADFEWYRVQYKRMQDDKKNDHVVEDDESEFTVTDEELARMFDDDAWGEDIEKDYKKTL